jgi:nucleotide-binding universal stress UspA family protein
MAEIKKICCAIDFSEASLQVAEYALSLAKGLNAEIVFLYVAPTLRRYAAYQIETVSIDSFVAKIVAGAQEEMDRFLNNIRTGDQRISGKVLLGYAPEVIIEVAQEEKAGLVVMGTHGRKGIDTILFGSVAEKVLKKSPIPVLTIRPERR